MARHSAQNASHPPSRSSRDISNANLTLPYTGGVAAQCAVDSSVDPDDYLSPLDMQSETIPRSLPPGHPSRTRITSHLAAFSGDQTFPAPDNYYLTRDSQAGSQNYSAGNRQSIDLSSEPSSSTSHHHSDLPWTPLDATVTPARATLRQTRPTSFTVFPRTPINPLDPFSGFQHSGFHDSALGTISGPSQDERQTVLSSTIADMDLPYGWHPRMEPEEVQHRDEEERQDPDEQDEEDETELQGGQRAEDPTKPKPKNQRPVRTREELTCTVPGCDIISKTPSDFKKHQARHDAPHKCDYADCPRSTRGFATINDLHRHKKSVHGENARNSKYYKCFAPNCPKAEKPWPRLDNFRQHLNRMHDDQDAEVLVQRSNDWYGQEHGSSAPTHSPAITNVLRSQERAARQSKKRGRDSESPTPAAPPPKRIAVPPLQTQGMLPQDMTRLSPLSASLSAQPMSRHSSSHSQQPMQSSSRYNIQNNQLASYQRHWTQQYPQMQSANLVRPGVPMSNQRRGTEGQIRRVMQPPMQSTDPLLFNSDHLCTFGPTGPASQPPAFDQWSQVPSSAPPSAVQPRPHTSPDANADFNQTQIALIDQSNAIPPGQDDMDIMNQYLAEFGAGTNIPQSSPGTSNGPQTPHQSVQLPSIAIDNESGDGQGKINETQGSLVEEVESLLRQHGTKGQDGRLQLSTRSLQSFLQSVASMSSLSSTYNAQTSRQSTTASASSRTGRTNHICSKCRKSCPRQSDLKKHMKRHTRPYGCVLDNCYKRFGSKNDLKRHETNMHSEQKECYRCDGSHRSEDGQQCFQVFYHGRDNYKKHLEHCLTKDPHQVERKANACRIPANNQGRFWCGFCNKIIEHEIYGIDASNQRLTHIDAHFTKEKWAADWIELGGNGLTKQQVEIKQNEARNHQIRARGLHHAQQLDEDDSQGSSPSSTSPDNVDDSSQYQASHGPQRPAQHRMQPLTLQRQRSNNGQYQQMTQQQMYQQQVTAQQMQRGRSHGSVTQQATDLIDLRDPPQESRYNEHGQRLSRHATCCRCELAWPLDLGRQCTSCFHDLCSTCRRR